MHVARWALIGAAILAAFQAWLWAGQDSLMALAGAIALALLLLAVALRPGTRLAQAVNRSRALPRASGETERHYGFRIGLAWLVVLAACVAVSIAIRGIETFAMVGIALRVFGFISLIMALQSFLVGLFRAPETERAQ